VIYDDETLMAYADGELDAERRAEIAAAAGRDPALALRIETHRALRARVAGAYAAVLDGTVPDKLRAAARGVAPAASGGTVVRFPQPATSTQRRPWRAREWLAVAASLVLGLFVSWSVFAPGGAGLMDSAGGALVARGELANALDRQLASDNDATRVVSIGLTFRTNEGGYCRHFALREARTAGLACREGGEWRIPVTAATQISQGDHAQAAGAIPPPILAAIEARLSGEPLDAAAEASAARKGWSPDATSP
jgi:hypothetical protein